MITHKCPVCGGQITDITIEEYEDGNEVRVVTKGRCAECGSPYKYVKVIKLRKHEYIT